MALRRWPLRVCSVLALLGCTGEPEESEREVAAVAPVPVDDCRPPPQLDIPERECSGELLACESSGGTCLDTCVGCDARALSAELVRRIQGQCGVGCGVHFTVAVRDSCITTIHHSYEPFGELDCVRELLLGTRWGCGPELGLVSASSPPCGPR